MGKIGAIRFNKSLIRGVGSIFDLSGSFYRVFRERQEKQSDWEKLRSDWAQTGADLGAAIASYEAKGNGEGLNG